MPISVDIKVRDVFKIECFGKDGRLKWREIFPNTVMDTGIEDVLDKYFKGLGYTAVHYAGLTSGTPTFSEADTMASHPGWTEVTDYSEGTRPQIVWGTIANKSIDNSTSKAVFSINASATIGGAFISTDGTKGGTTGTLYAGGLFTGGDRTLASGDIVSLQVTVSMTGA